MTPMAALILALVMLAALVAGMASLADGKRGVRDIFTAMGWMWLFIIGGGVLIALLVSFG